MHRPRSINIIAHAAGRSTLSFEVPECKLLESDTKDKSRHAIAVIYLTGVCSLLDNLGEYLVLANGDATGKKEEETETFVLAMQPGLSVISYAEVNVQAIKRESVTVGLYSVV